MASLTVAVTGNAPAGTAAVQGNGITCGQDPYTDCTEVYPTGTSVRLLAVPLPGAAFGGWSGACTGSDAECIITMDQDQTVDAAFSDGIGVPQVYPVIDSYPQFISQEPFRGSWTSDLNGAPRVELTSVLWMWRTESGGPMCDSPWMERPPGVWWCREDLAGRRLLTENPSAPGGTGTSELNWLAYDLPAQSQIFVTFMVQITTSGGYWDAIAEPVETSLLYP